MKLTERWTKDNKGRMVSRCKSGKVMVVRIFNQVHRKPYRVYVAGRSKGSYETLFEAFDRIGTL